MEFEDLKRDYLKFEKKYGLPSFKKLNEDFEVYKIDNDSDILLKVIRKVMVDKIVNSLGFVEMLMTPMNAPIMYHGYIKSMSVEDKESLDKIYSVFAELSINSLEREVDYSEEKEAKMIKKIYKKWDESRPAFRRILADIKKPNKVVKKEKSYFS